MKLLVVNNLASGYGEGSVYDFVRALTRDGDEVVIRSTDGTTDLRTFLYDAEDFDAVAAAGGDGTVSAVAYLLADTGIPLLPFPAGTANLLAMNLGLPTEPHALAKVARELRTMDFDLGEIALSDGERYGFSIMAGAGYDAAIMAGAAAAKKVLGPMAYFTSAFANATPQHARLKVTIDGNVVETDGVGVLVVNFSKIQFDLKVVHENLPRDGIFDVVVFHTKDAFGLIPAFINAVLDRTGDFPDRTDAFELYRGSSVKVEADPPLKVQFDGEVTETATPFSVSILPRACTFVVGEECERLFREDA
ncbi:MAG: diacylglycerol kinase [Eggerthellaceae bacterium]|nr:diacylglycerol kinase [Eggerthellaceae bacterium]